MHIRPQWSQSSAVARQNLLGEGGGGNLAERAPKARVNFRRVRGKIPWKCLKFSFLKSLKMHQILKTSTYIFHLCKALFFFNLEIGFQCWLHRFLWQHTACWRDYKPLRSTTRQLASLNRVLLSTEQLKRAFGCSYLSLGHSFYLQTNSHICNPKSIFFDSKTKKVWGLKPLWPAWAPYLFVVPELSGLNSY